MMAHVPDAMQDPWPAPMTLLGEREVKDRLKEAGLVRLVDTQRRLPVSFWYALDQERIEEMLALGKPFNLLYVSRIATRTCSNAIVTVDGARTLESYLLCEGLGPRCTYSAPQLRHYHLTPSLIYLPDHARFPRLPLSPLTLQAEVMLPDRN